MLFSEQVVDGFNRIKGRYGHFDKNRNSVGHGSVPQAR